MDFNFLKGKHSEQVGERDRGLGFKLFDGGDRGEGGGSKKSKSEQQRPLRAIS